MFNVSIKPTPRTSTAVEAIQVNPFKGSVTLRYTNGYEYKYSNVSRAKILNLLINDNMSLGFWGFNNLSKVAVQDLGYLRCNTVATGKLCYKHIGTSYFNDALPC